MPATQRPDRKGLSGGRWEESRRAVRARAAGRCESCGAENYRPHPLTGETVILTVVGWKPAVPPPEELRCLCRRCERTQEEAAAKRRPGKKRRQNA